MNEIEKLYENAGVEPIAEYCKHQCNNEFDDNACIGCKHIEKVEYPPFTAEKQIELIKLLAHKDYDKDALLININASNYTYFSLGINSSDDGNGLYEDYCFGSKQFDEALAGVVNLIWQDLTEEEKQQIRDILG